MYKQTLNKCFTFFALVLLLSSYSYGLTSEEVAILQELANKSNLSNATLFIGIFNQTTNITQNVTVFVNNDTYNRTQIDNFFANQSKSITDVNSSVNIEIIRLLNFYQNASVDIATNISNATVQRTLPRVIEEFDSVIRSLDEKYTTKDEFDTKLQNNSFQLRAAIGTSENFIRKDMNSNFVWTILLLIIVSAGSAFGMYKLMSRKIASIPKNFIVNMRSTKPLQTKSGNIDDIVSNETVRQRRMRLIELKNYTYKQKIQPWIKLQIARMINASEIENKEDVNKAIETLRMEMKLNEAPEGYRDKN